MDIMFQRRKNDANVQVLFPVNYNSENPTVDAVNALYCEIQHLDNNTSMNLLWQKYCPEAAELIEEMPRR